MWPLLIIGGIVAAVAVIAGWQLSTALGGMPFWVWAVGLGAVAYLFLSSESGKKATSAVTNIYLMRSRNKDPRKLYGR